jgi:hypothetical protein
MYKRNFENINRSRIVAVDSAKITENKKKYEAPQLVLYGNLTQLTATKGGSTHESGSYRPNSKI